MAGWYFSHFFTLKRLNELTQGGMTMQRLLMVIFFLLIFLLGNASMVTAQFSEAGVQKLRVAVDAPDFTLKELGGGKISLKELRGKIILLNFFATW
jgi:cytochrome oxidase Cu insertion factor (SCO1/SenC/PrrC family)